MDHERRIANTQETVDTGHGKMGGLFFLLAALCAARAASSSSITTKLGFLYASISLWGLTLAYLLADARILMKRPDGSMSLVSYILFGPYHFLNAILLRTTRIFGRKKPYHEIVPGIFLGSRLLGCDARIFKEDNITAVLDLAGEFAETRCFRNAGTYLSLPTMDASAPSQESLSRAVEWIREARELGGVYVHCASGHGRSAMVIAAYLLDTGVVDTPKDAEQYLKERRSGVGLRTCQRQVLGMWWKRRPRNQSPG